MAQKIGPFQGAVAWTAADLDQDQTWRVRLTDAERDEVRTAARTALSTGKPTTALTAKNFPLPTLGPRLIGFRDELEGGRGFVLLQGLPVEDFTDAEAPVLLWGIGQYLGIPEPQDKAGALLHVVTDTGAEVDKSDNIRGFQTNEELNFHTDGADIFALMCLRTAKSGGRSRLVSSVAIYNAILEERPDLAAELRAPFHFDARAQNQDDAKVQTLPVFTAHDGLMSALYKRRYIETAQRFPELPRLTDKQIEALDYLDKTANDPRFHLSLTLAPGDLEIGNNATCFHARDTYTDHADPAARRCMLRLWLTLPNGRPLPKIYETTREWGPTYRRRMLQQSAAE